MIHAPALDARVEAPTHTGTGAHTSGAGRHSSSCQLTPRPVTPGGVHPMDTVATAAASHTNIHAYSARRTTHGPHTCEHTHAHGARPRRRQKTLNDRRTPSRSNPHAHDLTRAMTISPHQPQPPQPAVDADPRPLLPLREVANTHNERQTRASTHIHTLPVTHGHTKGKNNETPGV